MYIFPISSLLELGDTIFECAEPGRLGRFSFPILETGDS
jgi:hypothetical protein